MGAAVGEIGESSWLSLLASAIAVARSAVTIKQRQKTQRHKHVITLRSGVALADESVEGYVSLDPASSSSP